MNTESSFDTLSDKVSGDKTANSTSTPTGTKRKTKKNVKVVYTTYQLLKKNNKVSTY